MNQRLFLSLLLSLFATSAFARILQVGPTRQYTSPSKVMAIVQDGDTVDIDPVLYSGDVGTWNKNHLVLRGAGGKLAHLDAAGKIAASKGIWVIDGNNTTVEYIEFSGATLATDKNGAGIRMEGSGLSIRHCYFHNNDDGILTNPDPTSDVVIQNTEFAYNGFGDGYSHNMYIGHNRSFTLEFCYSHNAKVGHCVKTRATTNNILYNRIMDSTDGTSSYLIDMPNGGRSYVIGNILQKGAQSQGSALIEFGAEGLINPDSELYVVNNTWVNQKSNAQFYHVYAGTKIAYFRNNLFAGPGIPAGDTFAVASNVKVASANDPGFLSPQNFDYHLIAGARAIDSGIIVGDGAGVNLMAVFEYVHPLSFKVRSVAKSGIDAGAYQFQSGDLVAQPNRSASLLLYPNPAQNSLQVSYGNPRSTLSQARIYDMLGRCVSTPIEVKSEQAQFSLDLHGLPSGLYSLEMLSAHETRRANFVIAR